MYGVVLILVLIITGGVIAFIGDRLGTRVGKRKMTIFGLRPKHTSILVTIVTGVLITTMTLGVMSVMSENVRTALFGMERLNRDMQQAKADLDAAVDELAKAKAEQAKISEELLGTKKELTALTAQRDELSKQTEELKSLNVDLASANDLLTANNKSLQQKSDKLTRIKDILEEGNERLSKDNSELYQINRELTTGIKIMREGSITFRAGETLAVGIIRGKGTIDEIHADMGRILEMARYTVASRLNSNATDAEKDVWIYQPEFEEAASYISQHDGEFIVRLVAAGNLVQGEAVASTLQLFDNKTVYADGDLIAQETIKFNPANGGELQSVLTSFLSVVNQRAREKGMIPDAVSGNVGVIDSEQIYGILNQLQHSDGEVTISAAADGSTNVIGPLRIRLQLVGGI